MTSLVNISTGKSWCPYCSRKKLCEQEDCNFCYQKSFASHEKAKFWNETKNGGIKPREVFKGSNKKYWFTCDECKHDFLAPPEAISRLKGTWCPTCKYKTEKKFAKWLVEMKIDFEKEKKFPWCINEETGKHFRFDFFLNEHQVIIEVDGIQHVKTVKHFKQDLQTNIKRDRFKEFNANKNGYHIIRIGQEDILFDRIPWKEQLMACLEEIKQATEKQVFMIASKKYIQAFIDNLI